MRVWAAASFGVMSGLVVAPLLTEIDIRLGLSEFLTKVLTKTLPLLRT